MGRRTKDVPKGNRTAPELQDQDVVRANKELAAYFKGQRTEREARGALKIVKAFIRDRERIDPAKRRPLPGAESPKVLAKIGKGWKVASPKKARGRRKGGRQIHAEILQDAVAPDALSAEPVPEVSSEE